MSPRRPERWPKIDDLPEHEPVSFAEARDRTVIAALSAFTFPPTRRRLAQHLGLAEAELAVSLERLLDDGTVEETVVGCSPPRYRIATEDVA